MSFDHLFEGLTRTKFEPCLTVRSRCEILALLRRNIKPYVLASMYSVGRHTVHTIGRETSPHYRAIRAEYAEIGRDAFEAKYLTEDVIRRALVLQRGEDEAKAGGLRPDPVKPTGYNRRASSRRGHHACEDANGIEIEFDVEWRDAVDGSVAAWYYKEAGYDAWTGPYFTSASAYEGVRQSKTQEQLDG